MREIHVVQRDNRHLYEKYFDPYFRLRHDIYVKQRKWMALDRPDGREIDQFDTEDAVYLFCLDGGQLIGAMRALPTVQPTLMTSGCVAGRYTVISRTGPTKPALPLAASPSASM